MYEFRLNFASKFVPIGPINNNSYSLGSDNGLSPNRHQAIIWANDGLAYCRIYMSLGVNELKDVNLTICF